MKKFFASLGIFGAWLMVTIICGIAIALGVNVNMCSAIIMSLFMILPVRDWIVRLLIWGINFLSSNMDSFRDKITPWATMNTILDSNNRTENKGFYLTLKLAVAAVCGFIALILWVMQGFSANIVYGFAHSVVVIFRKLAGTGLERASIFFWLILCIICTAILIWFVSLIMRGVFGLDSDGNLQKSIVIRDCVILIVSFVVARIKNYLLLSYTWSMIITDLLFWLCILVIPTLFIIFILPRVGPLVRKIFH